jgi:hypothetical protein
MPENVVCTLFIGINYRSKGQWLICGTSDNNNVSGFLRNYQKLTHALSNQNPKQYSLISPYIVDKL